MSRTGLEDAYIMRGSKKLRMGYTTGSCAAAAARGAAFMLLSGKEIQEVKIHTPKGIVLNLELLDIRRSAEKVSCAVRKDGGDDPDVTDKALIYAEVTFGTEEGIVIDGGFGVGRVTKPGLDQPVGNAAINHVPRQMIRENVEEIQKKLDDFRALQVIISVPEGEELAKHTFNPRLGITGGISILGTSGIVVPMSEEALISTIRVEMEMRKAQGDRVLLVTPGNYGQDFLKTYPWVRADHSVKCSNYVGKTLEFAAELGFDAILFVAHLGKFVKVSGGIMNTHSHEADCRAELLTAQAVRAGADLALAKKLLETGTTEEAVQILKEAGCLKETMEKVTEKIAFYMNYHIEGRVQTEAIVFSSNEGMLGGTRGAENSGAPAGAGKKKKTEKSKNKMTGILFGTGIGPGDPELMTLKAVRLIRENDTIAVPGEKPEESIAYQIAVQAVPELAEKELVAIPMPMTKNAKELEENHRRGAEKIEELLDAGKNVVFLTLGDPTVYSTYLYVHRRVLEDGYDARIVSGVTSFCAAAASLSEGLVENSEELHVIPASYQIEDALELSGTKVLMKAGKKMPAVKQFLKEKNCRAVMVENCGMDTEQKYFSAEEIPDQASYYSLIIVKEKRKK